MITIKKQIKTKLQRSIPNQSKLARQPDDLVHGYYQV